MRIRAEIYGKEVAGLLRAISLYPGILGEQLCRFHPGKEDVARNLLAHLKRQGRGVETDGGRYFPYGMDARTSGVGMGQAVWVLLDFADRVEFYVPGDFPVQIVFFSGGEFYEIVHDAPVKKCPDGRLKQYTRERIYLPFSVQHCRCVHSLYT